ncbi:MAG: Gldg family protein [Planctomycetota bacterium]|nr:Gldg family protein [Planctomycetota bacterium]
MSSGKGWMVAGASLTLGVLFVGVNMLAGVGLSSLGSAGRIDLTQDRLYTLSPGTAQILKDIPEPIRLTLYYSARAATGSPSVQSHAQRVRDLLDEFVRRSGGKLRLEVVDPQPFTDEEDRANAAGLAAVPAPGGEDPIFLGLVGVNSVDGQQVLPFLDPNNERFLEYDLARMIASLSLTQRPVLGLISTLPVNGGFELVQGQPRPTGDWIVMREIKATHDVRQLDPTAQEIPADVNVLMLVHPKGLSDRTLWAIDQFVLRGGKLLAFVDPLAEMDLQGATNQVELFTKDRASNLSKLLSAWGVEVTRGQVVGDAELGQRVVVPGRGGQQEAVQFVAWMGFGAEQVDRADPITANLSRLILASPGQIIAMPIDKDAARPVATITPLVRTTDRSMLIAEDQLKFQPDPRRLLAQFTPSGSKFTVAARLGGKVQTAFPEGRPELPEGQRPAEPEAPVESLKESGPSGISVVLVADVDLLADRFWVQEQRLGNVSLGLSKSADNGDFVINAVDNLSGAGTGLIGLRARGQFNRPFDRVEAIRRDAQAKSAQKEQEVNDRIRSAQLRINELQRLRGESGTDDAGRVILSPEQQEELKKVRQDLAKARTELRNIQRDSVREIDRLGVTVKLVNTALLPAVVALGAVSLGLYRMGRRRGVRLAEIRAEARDK